MCGGSITHFPFLRPPSLLRPVAAVTDNIFMNYEILENKIIIIIEFFFQLSGTKRENSFSDWTFPI
jgi:hypothetical protein